MITCTTPNNRSPFTLECKVHFKKGQRGCKKLSNGEAPNSNALNRGRVPRISRLMALAIRFEQLIRKGDVRDMAELACLGHVSRARISQIMNMLHLAPDIQEAILFLPGVPTGKDPITERHIRRATTEVDWDKQRQVWKTLQNTFLDANPSDLYG
jgi:hypothetical protein